MQHYRIQKTTWCFQIQKLHEKIFNKKRICGNWHCCDQYIYIYQYTYKKKSKEIHYVHFTYKCFKNNFLKILFCHKCSLHIKHKNVSLSCAHAMQWSSFSTSWGKGRVFRRESNSAKDGTKWRQQAQRWVFPLGPILIATFNSLLNMHQPAQFSTLLQRKTVHFWQQEYAFLVRLRTPDGTTSLSSAHACWCWSYGTGSRAGRSWQTSLSCASSC